MNSHNPLVHAVTASGRLLAHVKARSDSPAVLVDDAVVSWRDLDDASRRVPTRGLAKGDRAAVFADNSLDVIVALLAHHRRGVVHVPINPGYQGAEREHVVADSGAKVVLTSTELAEREPSDAKLRDDDDDDDDDTCLLIYTSGTTGKSKGCELTVKNVVAAVSSLASLWEITSDDEIVHALPLFHVHGLCVALHGALLQGARTRLLKRFTPEGVVDGVARGGTVFMGVPTMYRRLLDHLAKSPRDADVLARARLFTAGSAPLPADDLEEFARRTGHRIVERYGMSETLITLSNPLHGARKAGTVGKPVPGVTMRLAPLEQDHDVVGDGHDDDLAELCIKGPGVMRGYWNDPRATAAAFDADGWLKTGDLARVDDDGYVTIVGRLSTDILKVGGYKISTREIEEQLARVAGVVEVAVVGAPDREWGQKVVAVVVVAEPLRALGAEALLARLQEATALHASKKPRAVLVVDALPRNAMGKVQKKELERRVATR